MKSVHVLPRLLVGPQTCFRMTTRAGREHRHDHPSRSARQHAACPRRLLRLACDTVRASVSDEDAGSAGVEMGVSPSDVSWMPGSIDV